MKILLFFCFQLIAFAAFTQKITYKDLVGTTWATNNLPASDSESYTFIDSSHFDYYYISKKEDGDIVETEQFKYSLDTSYTPTLWYFETMGRKNYQTISNYCFIKITGKNILETQFINRAVKPRKDEYNENIKVAYSLRKII